MVEFSRRYWMDVKDLFFESSPVSGIFLLLAIVGYPIAWLWNKSRGGE